MIANTFGSVFKNFGHFLLLMLAWFAFNIALAIPVWVLLFITGSFSSTGAAEPGAFTYVWMVFYYVFTSAFVIGIVTTSIDTYLSGQKPKAGQSIGRTLKRFLPLSVVVLLSFLGIMAGSVLLYVPGIILSIYWVATSQATVSEDIRIMEAFGRSSELTKDNRWIIFGSNIVFGLIFSAAMLGMFLVLGGVMAATGVGDTYESSGSSDEASMIAITVVALLIYPMIFLLMMLNCAYLATLYHHLKVIKGQTARSAADTFV